MKAEEWKSTEANDLQNFFSQAQEQEVDVYELLKSSHYLFDPPLLCCIKQKMESKCIMISNFPIPYPDELIYSVIARYAIHNGILSPKYLTEELFNNRNLTPTYDLPSHLDRLSQSFTRSL